MVRTIEDLVIEACDRIEGIPPTLLAVKGGTVVIDVREPAECAQGHLPGAINLPRGVLEFQIRAHPAVACRASHALTAPDRELLLYCLTGGRSALAADSLRLLGLTRMRSLAGGLTAWRNAGLPLSTDPA